MAPHILAVLIFIAMFLLIVTDKIERHLVSLGCGLLMLVLVFGLSMHSAEAVWETLNVGSIFRPDFWYGEAEGSSAGVNWSTILFILGMMIMVEGMGRAGFFRWLCLQIARMVRYRTIPVFITFMIMSAVLAMFIDSITVILFLAAVTLELAQILKCNPLPMILAEVFCANLGGSATMCGDPPNIIIGTSLHYSFADFISNTGVIAGISLIAVIVYFYLCFHRELSRSKGGVPASYPDPKEAIASRGDFIKSCLIFGIAVALLVSHAQTGLTVAFIGVFIAALTLLSQPRHAGELLRKVDYKTLLFFVGLFVVVGGLEQTGVLEEIAGWIGRVSGSNGMLMCAIILWVSAFASAFVDNIPFAATMIPVIRSLAAMQGVDLSVLAWSLSMGTDIGGSATPIGASANVVGISVASKQGHPVSWGYYCKYSAPAAVLVVAISMVCIFLRYF
ncbi:MAG: SLC13 family permease [Eubacteriales bacterium]|nr:SLC13 family permease [Eubacteriales bacterium]